MNLDKLHQELDTLTNLPRDQATLYAQQLKIEAMLEIAKQLAKLNDTLETGTIVVESPGE